jgi:hypothetical protein
MLRLNPCMLHGLFGLTVEALANGCTHRDALHGGWGYDGYGYGYGYGSIPIDKFLVG